MSGLGRAVRVTLKRTQLPANRRFRDFHHSYLKQEDASTSCGPRRTLHPPRPVWPERLAAWELGGVPGHNFYIYAKIELTQIMAVDRQPLSVCGRDRGCAALEIAAAIGF